MTNAGLATGPGVQAPGRVEDPRSVGVLARGVLKRGGRAASLRWPGGRVRPIAGEMRREVSREGGSKAAAPVGAVGRRDRVVARPLVTDRRPAPALANRVVPRAAPRRVRVTGRFRVGSAVLPGRPVGRGALGGRGVAAAEVTAANVAPRDAGPRRPRGNVAQAGLIDATESTLLRVESGLPTTRCILRVEGLPPALARHGRGARAVRGSPRPEPADVMGRVRPPVPLAGGQAPRSAVVVRLIVAAAAAAVAGAARGPRAPRPAGEAARTPSAGTAPPGGPRHPDMVRVVGPLERAEAVPRGLVTGSPGDAARTVHATRRCPPR